ncbi:MAG TPA: VWA domain-containing protein [Vicinamibacterales bacterium]|nr:VWA domain-containing protein [Vicinamibacterales bacterium]
MRLMVGLAAAVLLAQQATFRSGVDAVTVDVSVRRGTRVVTGLGVADFEVLDNGVPQQVTSVSYGKLPIDVTLALDTSFSVSGALLERLRAAVRQLMRDLGPEDRLRLIDFNMRVSRPIDFTSDPAKIDAAIGAVSAGGGSSIRDALSVALVSASEPERRQLIVLFSDGADSTSITTPEALIDLAQRTNASVAAVIPEPGGAGSPARQGLDMMRALAAETGGTVITMPLASRTFSAPISRTVPGTTTTTTVTTFGGRAAAPDLTATFRRVLEEFRSSYVLHFTPRGVEAGGFHTLDVKVKGKGSLTVRARRGYAVR